MKDLTVDISTFEDLRKGNFLYIDKTEYLWKLVRPGKAKYFLSRPRRFGKSLTLSTLEAIFKGKKELFEGLAIYDKPYDWSPHPVIHLTLGSCCCHTSNDLRTYLAAKLQELADDLGLQACIDSRQLSLSFSSVIKAAYRKEGSVVVLIDEYDKPLLENLLAPEAQTFRDILGEFYSPLKELDACERFVFLTGVTKFCHVSLFSKLNNLLDLTMSSDYATMLGYTQAELEANFKDWLAETEAQQDLPHDKYLAQIKAWYDGYRFEETAENVYNPVSVASFFLNHGKFYNYWFSTGTPAFLLELMKKEDFNFPGELNSALSEDLFNSFELDRIDPLLLLYQTGYVTIAECRKRKMEYTDETINEYFIRFPNREVKESFHKYLLGSYTGVQENNAKRLIQELIQSVGSGNAEAFIKILKGIFAGIPYGIHVRHEHYYQTIIYVIFDMLRFYIHAEHQTSDGRVDLMLSAGNWIYVVELKLDKSAGEAMKQIENKEYALQFRNRGKRIMAIGINFDSERGQISDWMKEEI